MFLTAAQRDLQALGNMLDAQTFPLEIFGFHAQQTVEKCLKSRLCLAGREIPRTHNIRHLIVLLEEAGIVADDLWDLVSLTAFAVQFRYEPFDSLEDDLDRAALFARIHGLVARCASLLD
jgi:HEPN domain-containing protein